MRIQKDEKGIALISLAVTIIVLIILSGVAITLALDNRGLIAKSNEAVSKWNEKEALKEQIMKNIELEIEDINGGSSSGSSGGVVAPVTGFLVIFLLMVGQTFKTKENATSIEFPNETPTREGYNFTGWYYDQACTNKATEGDTINANTTLYAGWQLAKVDAITNKQNGARIEKLEYGVYESSVVTILQYKTTKEIDSCIMEIDDEGYVYDGKEPENEKAITEEHFLNVISSDKKQYDIKIDLFNLNSYKLVGIKVKIFFVDGTYDSDEFVFLLSKATQICLAEGTMIKLKDGTEKTIEDITYEDELLVWDFDNGCLASAKPLWIQQERETNEYNLLKFENGSELKTISQHRIFNKELGKFTYPMTNETPIGTTTVTSNGEETKLISKEVITENVKYYNVITNYHMNLFANNILTSCRLSNLYEIRNMKYVKDGRQLTSKEEFENIPNNYFVGLRLSEQPREINRGNDVKHDSSLNEYVNRLINSAKKA